MAASETDDAMAAGGGRMRVGPALLFFLASTLASTFPLALGRLLWPDGLSAGTETLFWPATGIHVAGLLLLGARAWPVVVLGTVAGQMLMMRPLLSNGINTAGNLAEALAALWMLRRAGVAGRKFFTLRGTGWLLAAAMIAPLCSSLPGAASLVLNGWIPPGDYAAAVSVWTLANGVGVLFLTPFLVAVFRGKWDWRRRGAEVAAWLALGVLAGTVAFDAVFRAGGGMNLAFLVFPFVIYAAVRLGVEGVSLALVLVMAFVYGSLALHAPVLDPGRVYRTLWFVQSFCFVLGATGLLLAALVGERHRAEEQALRERNRALEAALREERARLEALRWQINPHFLFNALNSVYAALKPAQTGPAEMVGELADYLRSTLANPDRDVVPLEEELASARTYVSIQQKRHGPELDAAVTLEPEVARVPVPVFLLQPLVENAIRHGFGVGPGNFSLEIRARRAEGGLLRVEVVNSGAWKTGDREGVGLANIRRRLALLYGERAALHCLCADNRVCVRIEIPLDAPPAAPGKYPA